MWPDLWCHQISLSLCSWQWCDGASHHVTMLVAMFPVTGISPHCTPGCTGDLTRDWFLPITHQAPGSPANADNIHDLLNRAHFINKLRESLSDGHIHYIQLSLVWEESRVQSCNKSLAACEFPDGMRPLPGPGRTRTRVRVEFKAHHRPLGQETNIRDSVSSIIVQGRSDQKLSDICERIDSHWSREVRAKIFWVNECQLKSRYSAAPV